MLMTYQELVLLNMVEGGIKKEVLSYILVKQKRLHY